MDKLLLYKDFCENICPNVSIDYAPEIFNTKHIERLYKTISDVYLDKLISRNKKSEAVKKFRKSIKSVVEAYKKGNSKSTIEKIRVNFDSNAQQLAYFHRYAPIHAAMVFDILQNSFSKRLKTKFWKHWLSYNNNNIDVCSLGGGPGCDVIGVVAALSNKFENLTYSAKLIDAEQGWERAYETTMIEIVNGNYGRLSNCVNSEFFTDFFIKDDLLNITPLTIKAIEKSNFVTMIKLLSSIYDDTTDMVKNIFTILNPGTVLFFIDNDGGGFSELVYKTAVSCNLVSIFALRMEYENELFKNERFHIPSCYSTKITAHMLIKLPCSVSLKSSMVISKRQLPFVEKCNYQKVGNDNTALKEIVQFLQQSDNYDDEYLANGDVSAQDDDDYTENSENYSNDDDNYSKATDNEYSEDSGDYSNDYDEYSQDSDEYSQDSDEYSQDSDEYSQDSDEYSTDNDDYSHNSKNYSQNDENYLQDHTSLSDEDKNYSENPEGSSEDYNGCPQYRSYNSQNYDDNQDEYDYYKDYCYEDDDYDDDEELSQSNDEFLQDDGTCCIM